MTEVM